MTDKTRESFEAWYSDYGANLKAVERKGESYKLAQVSAGWWAWQAAIKAFPRLKADLSGLYLRDLRKRAADLADDMESASKLLQHSSLKLTSDHYRTKPTKLKAVR